MQKPCNTPDRAGRKRVSTPTKIQLFQQHDQCSLAVWLQWLDSNHCLALTIYQFMIQIIFAASLFQIDIFKPLKMLNRQLYQVGTTNNKFCVLKTWRSECYLNHDTWATSSCTMTFFPNDSEVENPKFGFRTSRWRPLASVDWHRIGPMQICPAYSVSLTGF